MRQPTPVLSAMRNILFIVPRNRFRVPSKLSFIFSANAVESRISSPIATVIFFPTLLSVVPHSFPHYISRTYILQHPDLLRHLAHMVIVLTLKLVDHGITVLSFPVGCSRPKTTVPIAALSAYCISTCARVRAEACPGRSMSARLIMGTKGIR